MEVKSNGTQREAKNAAAPSHPEVVRAYDAGETADGIPYMAVEFVESGSLDGSEPVSVRE